MSEAGSGEAVGHPSASSHPATQLPPGAEAGGKDAPVFRGTGVSVALVVGLAVSVLAIIVAFQNTDDVGVDFLAWDVEAPLLVVLLAAAVAGVLVDEILGFFWRRRRRQHLAERAELRRLRGR